MQAQVVYTWSTSGFYVAPGALELSVLALSGLLLLLEP